MNIFRTRPLKNGATTRGQARNASACPQTNERTNKRGAPTRHTSHRLHHNLAPPPPPPLATSVNARSNPPDAMCTSFATCSAVIAESPVAIITVCEDAFSALTTSGVSVRTGHANARNPSNVSPRSISSLVSGHRGSFTLCASSVDNTRCASAMMRYPCSASLRYARSYPAGFFVSNVATISGEPFISTHAAGASLLFCTTLATADIRCSALEKWLRTRIFTMGLPVHDRVGGFGGGSFAAFIASSLAGSFMCSVGTAVCDRGSNRHFTPRSAACSSGSPNVFPSTWTNEWHPATTSDAALDASAHGVSSEYSPSSPPAPAPETGVTTPTATSWSDVSVPVLSNKHVSTLPLIGTRNGSVQNTAAFMSASSAVFTAIAVCIGSSGGTTEVRMRMQRNTSSYCERLPSLRPTTKTCPLATHAKTRRMKSNTSVSHVSPVTCSEENSIMRISFPCVELNPVCRT
mmetsp:Transcript_2955/g.9694  ORF Transcript_2955/g.9694 Transcript_2955/m.9694 type:complete len:462 (-) Transcript_2955:1770-3155(-)